ncbi:hypothetical protein [Thiomonas sp. FB-Cd]|uniref:hypothetical protein n=1 Tax=Thiomonas sp. FB-Cd TaxID=1158292 RepID=UPI000AC710D0|nr:hypothetical protein [Thiomonas sp. FB-Cd]
MAGDPIQANGIDIVQWLEFPVQIPPTVSGISKFFQFRGFSIHQETRFGESDQLPIKKYDTAMHPCATHEKTPP